MSPIDSKPSSSVDSKPSSSVGAVSEGAGRRVGTLFLYPFKSAGGVSLESVEVDAVGLRDDRRWMIVGARGDFVSQRTHPRMALARARLLDEVVEVTAPPAGTLHLDRAAPEPERERVRPVRVWFSDRYAVDAGDDAARWATAFLGEPCRILQAVRPPASPLLSDEGRVRAGFADASPALVVSTASLANLNARVDSPLPMDRFRPNVVVEGFAPFEEDGWRERRVGDVPTRGGRPCPRCAATLVDQATGEKGVEPLHTLATFRRNAAGEVEFGVNVHFLQAGRIRVGDRVTEATVRPA